MVVPLLGFTYLLTVVGPSEEESHLAHIVFEIVRAALLSTQGAIITLPYCFLNTEVQGVVTRQLYGSFHSSNDFKQQGIVFSKKTRLLDPS